MENDIRDEDCARCAECNALVCICSDEVLLGGDEQWAAHCRHCSRSMSYEHDTPQNAANWWNEQQALLRTRKEMKNG